MEEASEPRSVTIERRVWGSGAAWRRDRTSYVAYVVRVNGVRVDAFLSFRNAVRKARTLGKWSYTR